MKKILSLLFTVVMINSLIPQTVFADTELPPPTADENTETPPISPACVNNPLDDIPD